MRCQLGWGWQASTARKETFPTLQNHFGTTLTFLFCVGMKPEALQKVALDPHGGQQSGGEVAPMGRSWMPSFKSQF